MLTCENCIHSSVCTPYNTPNDDYPNIGDCPHFKNKADYAPVVRCKDCKYAKYLKRVGVLSCQFWNTHSTDENAFCSYGERKEK